MKEIKGFTLIEVLAASAIISIVALVSVSLFYTGSNTYVSSENRMEIRQNVRTAMEAITQDIKSVNDSSKIKVENGKLYVGDNNYFYVQRKNTISMNRNWEPENEGHELANMIESFVFSVDGRRVSLTITGIDGFSLNSVIYLPK